MDCQHHCKEKRIRGAQKKKVFSDLINSRTSATKRVSGRFHPRFFGSHVKSVLDCLRVPAWASMQYHWSGRDSWCRLKFLCSTHFVLYFCARFRLKTGTFTKTFVLKGFCFQTSPDFGCILEKTAENRCCTKFYVHWYLCLVRRPRRLQNFTC